MPGCPASRISLYPGFYPLEDQVLLPGVLLPRPTTRIKKSAAETHEECSQASSSAKISLAGLLVCRRFCLFFSFQFFSISKFFWISVPKTIWQNIWSSIWNRNYLQGHRCWWCIEKHLQGTGGAGHWLGSSMSRLDFRCIQHQLQLNHSSVEEDSALYCE